MPAAIPVGENPNLSPASPSLENKMEATKRPRRHNFSFPTCSWGAQRLSPWVKGPSISSEATLPPLPPPNPSSEKEKEKSPAAEIPWNLRKRRGDVSSPVRNGSVNGLTSPVLVAKEKEKKKKTKLIVALSAKEIRDDYLLMSGKRPPSRPKKRPKHVQKQIDVCNSSLYPLL